MDDDDDDDEGIDDDFEESEIDGDDGCSAVDCSDKYKLVVILPVFFPLLVVLQCILAGTFRFGKFEVNAVDFVVNIDIHTTKDNVEKVIIMVAIGTKFWVC